MNHENLVAMLKRRGFVQPAYELYGGVAGFYDYGPLGALLKHRLETLWRRFYVVGEGFAEVSCPTISPEPVFQASGHLAAFADTVVECPACGAGHRGDHLLAEETKRIAEEAGKRLEKLKAQPAADAVRAWASAAQAAAEANPRPDSIRAILTLENAKVQKALAAAKSTGWTAEETKAEGQEPVVLTDGKHSVPLTIQCPSCRAALSPQQVRAGKVSVAPFNLMFKTNVGPGRGRTGYMRPETAQGIFTLFPMLLRYHRGSVPFGAVQIGRAYRNEIAPRQGLLRLREFWQMELEYFVDPEDKRHPRFAELADLRLNLVPNTGDEVAMTLGEAVKKTVVKNETVGYFVGRTWQILTAAGLKPDAVRFRQHRQNEMAHYAADCWDAEYKSERYGWVECVGIADRGCYDLEQHQKHSGQPLVAVRPYPEPVETAIERFVPEAKALGPLFRGKAKAVAEALQQLDPAAAQRPIVVNVGGESIEVPESGYRIERVTERVHGVPFVPHVIEPSYGIDRILWAALEHCWDESGEWAVLRLPPAMAPIQAAVLPLLSRDGLPERALEIERQLRQRGLVVTFDESGTIGRRYARMDEAGTPLCATIDHQTLEDDTVTLRWRDTQEQVRARTAELADTIGAIVRSDRTWDQLKAGR